MIKTFCGNGCPFGGEGRICGQDDATCTINALYREVLQHREGYETCTFCSMQNSGKGVFLPANLCGMCGHYCPACTAPKE